MFLSVIQGQYHDLETGLYYNRHRYYDPYSARFTTIDPIGLAGGLNNYQYVPNPTGWVDPLGLASCKGDCPGGDSLHTTAQLEAAQQLGVDPKWVDPEGEIKWPPNRGFDGEPTVVTIEPGTRIDRYGGYYDKNGNFIDKGGSVSPESVPFDQRALPNATKDKPYTVYEVIEPIDGVESGPAAPWFDQPGGGTQYDLPENILTLIQSGKIRPVK